MELMLDNANLETIKEFAEIYPYVGVTSNPTIIKKDIQMKNEKEIVHYW